MHWTAKYIGIPYEIGGRDGWGIDCWGLLRMAYGERFGIHLPSLPGVTALGILSLMKKLKGALDEEWAQVKEPFDGCGVAMSQSHSIHHVGVYADVDGGKIVHAWDGHNVIADSRRGLAHKGFKIVLFYRHGLHHRNP